MGRRWNRKVDCWCCMRQKKARDNKSRLFWASTNSGARGKSDAGLVTPPHPPIVPPGSSSIVTEQSHSSKVHAFLVRFCERNSVQGDNRGANSFQGTVANPQKDMPRKRERRTNSSVPRHHMQHRCYIKLGNTSKRLE
jgi:hypothetical protein